MPGGLQTTYLYYLGLFAFLKEDYVEAEKLFLQSLTLCHKKYSKNVEYATPPPLAPLLALKPHPS